MKACGKMLTFVKFLGIIRNRRIARNDEVVTRAKGKRGALKPSVTVGALASQ